MPSNPIIAPNRIKRALKDGRSVVGTMLAEIRQPSVMQLLVNAGFDFVIIDNEHGPFNIETIADLCRMAKYVGLTPIVRIPDLTYAHIAQSLDSGAQGIMVPRITTAQQVREIVEMMKLPPLGARGSALSRGYTNFKSGLVAEVMEAVNEETLLIVQIETREALEDIEEIITVPGVDAALIGPNDLSIALGVAGQLDSPEMQEALHRTIAACEEQNVAPGLHMNSLELAVRWAKNGMRLLSSSSEMGLMVKGGLEVTLAINKAFGR
jgi:2-dehydro-3-deoxyglucarate aldolase/4-hydroxy-2-oxoheptanedioate aldolase